MLRATLLSFLALCVGSASQIPEHKLIYRESGRLGGWPANHGIWQWGNEILVGFSAAWHLSRSNDLHQQDPNKPEEPRLARSLDGGETWTVEAPRDLLPPAQGGRAPQDLKQPIDFKRPGFAMTIRFLNTNSGPSLLWFTYDKGKSWSGPFRFPQLHNEVLGRTDYLIDGNREATVFLSEAKANHKEGRPFCVRTLDGGLTWKLVSYVGGEPEGFAIMPSTVRLSPSRLLTLIRVHEENSNRIDAYTSVNNGDSWTPQGPVTDTGLLGGNPPMLLKLRDGRLVVTYGYRSKPYSIRARISKDEGKTWGDVITLRDDAVAFDIGYTRSVQRGDGKIVTVYYYNDGPHNERFVAATIWDPDSPGIQTTESLDLTDAVIVIRPGTIPLPEKTAATMLAEELEKRSGVRLPISSAWPADKTVVALTPEKDVPSWGHAIPNGQTKAEGYRLSVQAKPSPVVWIIGADVRGTLYGAGQLLRRVDYRKGNITIPVNIDISTAPSYPIRGHQLGYRAQANSYDAWNANQFEQYIRELAFFGANSVESIPFHDDRKTPVMRVPRRDINRAMGEICHRYGLDYWAWIPAEFDLNDQDRRATDLAKCKEFFGDTPELTGVFFPGGDPGKNPPELVLPYLEDMAALLLPSHPNAKIWISLQWFTPAQVDEVYRYIDEHKPAWFGGLVAGPSSPPIPETRRRLPARYQLRSYPDLTHNKLSQYQVPAWDQAFALTLGREAVNPRPAEFALIHNRTAPYTDGFISYSDGVHDDVNKTVWSALSWNPDQPVRDILIDYARVYFHPEIAAQAADAILALERNWHGPLIDNGAVEGTLLQWQNLETAAPDLAANWRWQMCLLRANYDAFVRRRLFNETELEKKANLVLADAPQLHAETAMTRATAILDRASTNPESAALLDRISDLCDRLFHSVGLQTSVDKYFAIGEERGAVLDFVNYPLNNRWWLEDQFKLIRNLSSETAKEQRLQALAAWSNPGPGSFYDDVGNIAGSPHASQAEHAIPSEDDKHPEPTFWWWNQGKSRARLSWQTTEWPESLVYEGLDASAVYVVRSSGYGQALLRINGERVQPTLNGTEMGEVKEFPVPPKYLKSRRLVLTWDKPEGEDALNWRDKSRLAEVWLIKNPH